MTALLMLARSPREGAAIVLRDGRLLHVAILIAAATVVSAFHTARFASAVPLQDIMFGPGRSPVIGTLLATLGVERTSVLLYFVERTWDAVLIATALGPILLWILGATAIHAAARLGGVQRPSMPIFVLVGAATGVTRPVADLSGIVFGSIGAGAALTQAVGAVALVWLAVLVWHGVRVHYGVTAGQAVTILVVAAVLFYLVPLTVILLALVAILLFAVLLDYVPAR